MTRNKWLLIFFMSMLILSALILSYKGVNKIHSNVRARMECHGGIAYITLENEGDACRIYYVTVTEGDDIVEMLELNRILDRGKSVLELNITDERYKVSIVLDRGVIGGLSCGSSGRSQP